MSIATFYYVDGKLGPDSEDIKEWKLNYKNGCKGKDLDMTYALQNASLNGCGY